MRVVHFSDIHLDFRLRRIPLRDLIGKRLIGGSNYLLRRRAVFRRGLKKLEALIELVAEERPDLVVFSGDLTTLGTERELSGARAAIEPILATTDCFVCVPGNHDVYLGDVLRQGRFERHVGDLLVNDLPEVAVDGRWPLVRLVGDSLAVVAVDSSRPNPRPWRSSGYVPHRQIEALGELLVSDHRLDGRFVFVVTHYSPCLPDGSPDSRQHGLTNAAELLGAITPLGSRGALLCGHVHECFQRILMADGPRVFCAGSATYEGREGMWRFELAPGENEISAERGRWNGKAWSFEDEVTWGYVT